MKTFITTILTISLLSVFPIARADFAVVVHPGSSISSLTKDDVTRLFLGKIKSFPDGSPAVPINQNEGASVRGVFNKVICKKNKNQYVAYWSRLVFTGKGSPPMDVGGDAEVKALVAGNPNMVGYIDSGAVDGSVKVVYSQQ